MQDLLKDRAYQIIKDHAANQVDGEENPMFMYMAFPHTHWPVEAPLEYTDLYPDVDDSEKRRSFLGMVSHMDMMIANVTAALVETGMYDNTIIVFTSDNGAYTKWDWIPWYGGGDNGPLKGQKRSYYEGGTRVPAFVHSPMLKRRGYES